MISRLSSSRGRLGQTCWPIPIGVGCPSASVGEQRGARPLLRPHEPRRLYPPLPEHLNQLWRLLKRPQQPQCPHKFPLKNRCSLWLFLLQRPEAALLAGLPLSPGRMRPHKCSKWWPMARPITPLPCRRLLNRWSIGLRVNTRLYYLDGGSSVAGTDIYAVSPEQQTSGDRFKAKIR